MSQIDTLSLARQQQIRRREVDVFFLVIFNHSDYLVGFSYLMISSTEYFICLTANIIPKRSSRYTHIFFFLSSSLFLIILLDLYKISFFFVFSFGRFFSLSSCVFFFCCFYIHHYCEIDAIFRLLKCAPGTTRREEASSFDINRAAVCHFYISFCIEIRHNLSATCFTN